MAHMTSGQPNHNVRCTVEGGGVRNMGEALGRSVQLAAHRLHAVCKSILSFAKMCGKDSFHFKKAGNLEKLHEDGILNIWHNF
jgi:hypothetical protein